MTCLAEQRASLLQPLTAATQDSWSKVVCRRLPECLRLTHHHTGNASVQFAGKQPTQPLATLSGNKTFIIEPEQPDGNAVLDFGNQYNIINVDPGSTLILRRVAVQGLPPNFVNPPSGQPMLRNMGLLTWPSIVMEPGSTVRCFGIWGYVFVHSEFPPRLVLRAPPWYLLPTGVVRRS